MLRSGEISRSGGFRGTDVNGGNECRFCLYFPEADAYENRFFQYLSPAPEDEHESEHLTGEDDKISFAITHRAYYVVSNDCARLYKTSANTAEFSRKVAMRLYKTEKRPYGYVFGGSGGSFKTISCIEMTDGVWDGAAPYVLANPMATPNVFAPRCRAMLDLTKWCEQGIAPTASTRYEVADGQVIVPESADERGGLQPVVNAYVEGKKSAKVKAGDRVFFMATVTAPAGSGKITSAAWDFERTNDFSGEETLCLSEDGRKATTECSHVFAAPARSRSVC